MIKISSLHKFFNKGRENEIHVINDVSLELPERGMVAIFGKSGCGKTTLLNVIGGLDGFSSGSITLEGADIREDTDTLRNKYIGYIFQNYNLNRSETCFENVADALRLCGMSDESDIKERVSAALANVGMEKYAKRLPDTLSGGQQQRIAIARAIVKNPRIVLADEPTGNLDEANTVMVMNLLKAISREHLVLLVTHEANLVDYYCDKVVELSDGRIVGVRENDSADGYVTKDKNDIYLGELGHTTHSSDTVEIEYYGDKPAEPIKLTVVSSGGTTYLRIDSERIRILDDTSEVKLREGVFETKAASGELDRSIDMSKLPPIEGGKFGRLFSVASSVKSGFKSNFRNRKKGNKALIAVLCLLSMITVMMSAVFGTSIDKLLNARDAYNHNVFYVYTDNAEVSEKLNDAVGKPETGIDYISLSGPAIVSDLLDHVEYNSYGDREIYFDIKIFETFTSYSLMFSYRTNAVYLSSSLVKSAELLAGRNTGLSDEEIVISSKVADELLERSTLGYITEYEDLVGLIAGLDFTIGGKRLRVAGVVASDESAVYLSDIAMAKYVEYRGFGSYTARATEYSLDLKDGETVLAIHDESGAEYPALGEKITIHGIDFTVSNIIKNFSVYSYESWLEYKGITKLSREEYFFERTAEEYPELDEDSEEFLAALDAVTNEKYFEYGDYYYAEIGDLYKENYLAAYYPEFEVWLYNAKGVEQAKYTHTWADYCYAISYKTENGRYPTKSEYDAVYADGDDYVDIIDENYKELYYDEYSMSQIGRRGEPATYFVSDSDFISLSKHVGETHPTAKSFTSDSGTFTVIHSNEIETTEEWLLRELGYLDDSYQYKAVITPDDMFDAVVKDTRESIIGGGIAMAVMLALMCVCMYFIMRSSLMNRIKEIGIYRAIGASRGNLIFRFLVESAVLALFTVVLGFVITSVFISFCFGLSPLVSEIFYYPFWLGAADFVLLVALSLICGILPVVSLLRKTPSEILAKYDI